MCDAFSAMYLSLALVLYGCGAYTCLSMTFQADFPRSAASLSLSLSVDGSFCSATNTNQIDARRKIYSRRDAVTVVVVVL